MVIAAKKTSQVITHMAIAFTIAYAMTGSVVFSGLAIIIEPVINVLLIIEPVINVLLLPLHEKAWAAVRARATSERERYLKLAAEKVSQTLMHMGVAFAVIYGATGSLAFGGLAAILEPICNVLLLPIHDRFWDKLELRINSGMHAA